MVVGLGTSKISMWHSVTGKVAYNQITGTLVPNDSSL